MTRYNRAGVVLAVVALAAVSPTATFADGGGGGATHKTFAAKLAVDSDPATSGNAGTAGPVAVTGGTHSLYFSITNTSTGEEAPPYGSARIVVPAGFTSVTPSLPHGPSNFSVGIVGSTVTVVSTGSSTTGIRPNRTLILRLDVTVANPLCPTTQTWSVGVKQSNDFSGTGNDFVGNNVTTKSTGGDKLVWTTQPPAYAQYNLAMSPAPVATLQDACGNTVDYNGTVSITDTAGLLTGGSATATAVHGVATFPSLTFTTFEFDDVLSATAAGDGLTTCATGATCQSATFHVSQKVTPCASGASCTSGSLTDTNKTTSVVVQSGSGPSDVLSASVKGNPANAACDTSGEPAYGSLVTFNAVNRVKIVTQTLPKAYVHQITNNGVPFMDVCLSVPANDPPFYAKGDTGLTTPVHDGLLPDCPMPNNLPCIISRGRNAGDEVIVFQVPAGDPHSSIY